MIAIANNAKETTGTIIKGIPENRSLVENADENSCSSTDSHCGKATKEKVDSILLRQTTASIADALLRLGGSDDGGDASSSCDHTTKNRKRAVSLAAETDASSTSSESTDTDIQSIHKHTNKRQRKSPPPSQVVCSIPSKLCLPDSSKSSLHVLRERMQSKLADDHEEEQALSFSTSEFQIKPSEMKVPGDIGCISQLFHQDFRPLSAAPRLPRDIVPETPPQMPSMHSPFAPPATPATMYSTAITEHKGCLVMHSYTVLPRMIPPHMALAQLANGM